MMANGKWQMAKTIDNTVRGRDSGTSHLPGDTGHVHSVPCPLVMIDAELTN